MLHIYSLKLKIQLKTTNQSSFHLQRESLTQLLLFSCTTRDGQNSWLSLVYGQEETRRSHLCFLGWNSTNSYLVGVMGSSLFLIWFRVYIYENGMIGKMT